MLARETLLWVTLGAVSLLVLSYSNDVWQPVQAHSSVDMIQLGFILPLLGPK